MRDSSIGLLRTWTSLSASALIRTRADLRRYSGCLKCPLSGLAPWQAPQSMHREDGREDSKHADQEQRIDEEEVSGGMRHTAGNAKTLASGVDERHDQREQAKEEIDDVPRSSFSEHQR